MTWSFTRTPRGAVEHILAEDGNDVFSETTFVSFGWGDTVVTTEVNGEGHTTQRELDDLGRVVKVTDPNGVKTRQVLDSFGRVTQTFRTGVGQDAIERELSRVAYTDEIPGSRTVPNSIATTLFDANGPVRTEYQVLDGFGGGVQVWRPNQDETGFIVVDSVRDAMGNAAKTSYPRTEAIFAPTLPLGLGAQFTQQAEYDAFGTARWSVTDLTPFPTLVSNPAPGVTMTVDAEGYRKELHTDIHGRITTVYEGRVTSPMVQTGAYTYDGRNRVTTFTEGVDRLM